MDPSSQHQLSRDRTSSWLDRGRARLLQGLLHRRLRPNGPARLLEIGPGAGQNLDVLASFGQVEAVEAEPRLYPRLRAHPHLTQLHEGAVPDLDLDARYDAVVALDVLEHIDPAELAVRWVAEHLRPGGLFVASVPTHPGVWTDHDHAPDHVAGSPSDHAGDRPPAHVGDRATDGVRAEAGRITRSQLVELVGTALRIEFSSYFNTLLLAPALASRAAWLTTRRLTGADEPPTLEPSTPGGALDRALGRILRAEADRLTRGHTLPYGLTAVCVARRPA